MKTIATDRLTLAYLQKLSRYNYLATALVVLITTVSFFWLAFRIGNKGTLALFSDSAYTLTALISAFWCFQVAHWTRRGPLQFARNHRLAWFLVSMGMLVTSVGGAYYEYLQYTGQPLLPSYADIFFNLAYPLLFIGLLLMPTSKRFRIRMAFDALATMLCFFGVSWFLVIGPVYFAKVGQVTSFSKIIELVIALSYPCWDLVLILAIILFIQRHAEPLLHFSLLLICIGITATIWANSAYAYLNLFGTYQSGTFYIDPFWFVGSLLVGLSALYQHATIARRAYNAHTSSIHATPQTTRTEEKAHLYIKRWGNWWRSLPSLLFYVPFTLLLGLTVYGETVYDDGISYVLVILSSLVSILVAIRYLLATHDNDVLLQEREQRHSISEHLRHINTQLTAILDMEPLLEQIAGMATFELGFDAAMLLLIEDPDHPLDPQSSLLMNTAASNPVQHTNWRFQGDNLLYRIILAGKAMEVYWPSHTQDIPLEVRAWQQRQQLSTMLFLPLLYQGKIQGSLGFARHATSHQGQHDVSIEKAYVEQVAAVIERTRLYREAREHEAFAQAIANIATRLNAAAVEPAEIHQLICTEGANALQADYTLLYVPGEGEQLLPLAAYVGEEEIPSPQADWPSIQAHEQEAQAIYSLQPILLHLQQQPPTTNTLPTHVVPEMQQKDSGSVPPGLRELRRQRTLSLRDMLMRHFIHTVILAPLIAQGDPAGMLVFGRSLPPGNRDRRPFNTSDLPNAQDFAEQASVAFTNAQLYRHLRTAHQRLQELDQLKDQFMVTASHELRTPLTSVQGYLELLAQYDEILPTNQRQEFLQKARRSCDELVVLLGNVMDASRLEVESGIRPALMERVSVQGMIQSIINLIEPQLKQEQREVHVHIPSRLFAYADPIRLRQVLMNISVNALKYSPPRTPITFSVHTVVDRVPGVIISVTDCGKGIAPKDQAYLFQRFVRLERDINSPVRGSGLGLYISRLLIEAMNGKIWIESKGIPGEGSTFHIQLPLA